MAMTSGPEAAPLGLRPRGYRSLSWRPWARFKQSTSTAELSVAEAPPAEATPIHVPRRELTDSNERDDVKQLITVLLACLQRERARADQYYVRARNLLAYASALFTAVQVAFLANLGRQNPNDNLLISNAERNDIAIAAVIGAALLAIAVITLIAFADRARMVDVVGGSDVIAAWADPDGKAKEAVLETIALDLAAEERSWSEANDMRAKLNVAMAVVTLLASAAAIAELVFLYQGLA
jgi:hypothetical protein